MSKKKAVDCSLSWIWPKRQQYVVIDFLDKKGKTMRSSVEVVLNVEYLADGVAWDTKKLDGFVRSR